MHYFPELPGVKLACRYGFARKFLKLYYIPVETLVMVIFKIRLSGTLALSQSRCNCRDGKIRQASEGPHFNLLISRRLKFSRAEIIL